jgi:cysteinyl-tRNA synthetase
MVTLRGEKMAKSLGNVVGLIETLDAHTPEAVRLFYLRAQYRQPIEFADDLLVDAEASLSRLWTFRRRAGGYGGAPDADAIERFRAAMDDDFNTAEALAVLFDAVREGNRLLDSGEDPGPITAAFDVIVGVLGIDEPYDSLGDAAVRLDELAAEVGLPGGEPREVVDRLIVKRAEARATRDFVTGDRIRDRLAAMGIVLEDGADGTRWHR